MTRLAPRCRDSAQRWWRCCAPAAAAGIDENPARKSRERRNFAERPWPFLLDQWGIGRAFRCLRRPIAASRSIVYLRAKIGFCNCLTGVSDDEELDRVGDVSLLSDTFAPLRAGEPVTVGWMSGRSRVYDVAPRYAGQAERDCGGVQRQMRRDRRDGARAAHGAACRRARRAGVSQQRYRAAIRQVGAWVVMRIFRKCSARLGPPRACVGERWPAPRSRRKGRAICAAASDWAFWSNATTRFAPVLST